jgi:hypothetical protein
MPSPACVAALALPAAVLSWAVTLYILLGHDCYPGGGGLGPPLLFGHADRGGHAAATAAAVLADLREEFERLPAHVLTDLRAALTPDTPPSSSPHSNEESGGVFPRTTQLLNAALHRLPLEGRAKLLMQLLHEKNGRTRPAAPAETTIWDIPRTEIYADWRKPPGDLGSELRRNKKLGVTEIAKREAGEVVARAIQGQSRENKQTVVSDSAAVVRFDRMVDRERGVFYSVLLAHASDTEKNKRLSSIHMVRPFAPLRVSSVRHDFIDSVKSDATSSSLLNIVVAVHNRTPQLKKLIASLVQHTVNGGQHIRLVVVDGGSTDANVREEVLEKSGLAHVLYQWAPRRALKFSRALLLDVGIRAVHAQNPMAYFFTIDVDLQLPAASHSGSVDFRDTVWSSLERGRTIYAPIVDMKTREGASNYFDWGYGMVGAYTSDYVAVGGYDIERFQYGWGGEDIALVQAFLHNGFTVARPEEPGLVHLFHEKLAWRSKDHKTRCHFDWVHGEVCAGDEFGTKLASLSSSSSLAAVRIEHDDEVAVGKMLPLRLLEFQHGRSWAIEVSSSRHCRGGSVRQEAVTLDLPPGSRHAVTLQRSQHDNKRGMGSVEFLFTSAMRGMAEEDEEKVQGVLGGGGGVRQALFGTILAARRSDVGRLQLWTGKCAGGNVAETEKTAQIVVREVVENALAWETREGGGDGSSSGSVGVSASVAHMAVDSVLHCDGGGGSGGGRASVVLAPGFSYSFKAAHGGFDAGDGKIYFKVVLEVIPLLEATKDGARAKQNAEDKSKADVLRLESLEEATDALHVEVESLLVARAHDKSCSDNKGTMIVHVVRTAISVRMKI